MRKALEWYVGLASYLLLGIFIFMILAVLAGIMAGIYLAVRDGNWGVAAALFVGFILVTGMLIGSFLEIGEGKK